MTRRYRKKRAGNDLLKSNLQMMELFNSSFQVMAMRSDMMARAMAGELPLHHKEFATMWQEKFFAASESAAIVMQNWGKAFDMNHVMSAMAPYVRRASANAKRLKR